MVRLNIAMLSNEEQGNDQLAVQTADDHLEVLGQQVEDDLLQAQQVQIESAQEDAAVDDAITATEDLMEEQQAAEELAGQGQATQAAMESIQRNVKNILKTIGMEADQTGTSGKDTAKATASTIGDFIKKIWEKIKEVWFRIVDAIKAFFKNLFNASVGLKKRALAIKTAAKEHKGKKAASDAKFEAPESVKANMRMDYKAIPAATIDKGLARQNEMMNKFIKNLTSPQALSQYEASIGDTVLKITESLKIGNGKADSDLSEAVQRTMKPVLAYFPQVKGTSFGTPAFISDRVIALDAAKLTVTVEKIDGEKDLSGEHDPLEPFQIEAVCDIVAEQMDEYDNLDKVADSFKKFSKEIEKVQYDLVNEKKDVSFLNRKYQAGMAAHVTRFFMNVVKTVATQARVIDMQVNKAAIDWCAASLKLYK